MKNKLKQWLARFHQPRWRHGRLSALMLAAFLLVCVL